MALPRPYPVVACLTSRKIEGGSPVSSQTSDLSQDSPEQSPPSLNVCCPNCRHALDWHGEAADAPAVDVWRRSRTSPRLLVPIRSQAEKSFIGPTTHWCVGAHPPEIAVGGALAQEAHVELVELGLIDRGGRLTRFGNNIAYHLAEHHRQGRDDFISVELLNLMRLDSEAKVLDVGCVPGNRCTSSHPDGPPGLRASTAIRKHWPWGIAWPTGLCSHPVHSGFGPGPTVRRRCLYTCP